jgi:hypothetical protein
MSRSRLVGYWVTTGLVASSLVSAGVAQVLHVRGSRLGEQGCGPAGVLDRTVGEHLADSFRQRRSQ